MRTYGKIPVNFWRKKGRCTDKNTLILAIYLRTNQHANMIGLYVCPDAYMALDTGLEIEEVHDALSSLSDEVSYDPQSGMVWVHDMAGIEISPFLKEDDKRKKGVARLVVGLPSSPLIGEFIRRYADPFGLIGSASISHACPQFLQLVSPFEAPSEPHRSQGQGQVQGQRQGQGQGQISVHGENSQAALTEQAEPFSMDASAYEVYANDYARHSKGAA